MAMTPSTQEFLSPTETETPNIIKPADTATLVSKVRRATATSTRPPTSPAPTRTKVALSLEMQAGHSDGIAVIGILIVGIIIIPIMLKYKEWRVQ